MGFQAHSFCFCLFDLVLGIELRDLYMQSMLSFSDLHLRSLQGYFGARMREMETVQAKPTVLIQMQSIVLSQCPQVRVSL